MLKTAFIGQENFFDRKICEWLSEHTDLSLIIWTNKLSWSSGKGIERKKKVLKRFIKRARLKGSLRALNEFFYYVIYRAVLADGEVSKIKEAVAATSCRPMKPLTEIQQVRPTDIKAPELQQLIEPLQLDAIFSMCIDVYLPKKLIETPRYGSFLWHEGITPEYRGVYSPFWTLWNEDYDNLGYTLLRMNSKLDAGDIFVQGRAADIDPFIDWHSYIGHKSILDSLPKVKQFLIDLECNRHQAIDRGQAADGYYSYPTASALLRIIGRRWRAASQSGKLSQATQK